LNHQISGYIPPPQPVSIEAKVQRESPNNASISETRIGFDRLSLSRIQTTIGRCIQSLSGHLGTVRAVAFSSDGQIFASGSVDKTIKIWNPDTGELLHTYYGHSGGVNCVAFSPGGQTLASGSFDKTIKIWNLESEELLNTLTSSRLDVVHSLAFSPNGSMLVSRDNDKRIKIWSLRSGKVFRNLEGHSGWVSSIAINPDGKTLSSGSADRTVKIWGLSSIPDFGTKPPSVLTVRSFG